MDYLWIINGLSMNNPWIIRGLSKDYPWIIHGFSVDYPRIIRETRGFPIDNRWIIHGLSLDYPGIIHRQSMGEPEADILGGCGERAGGWWPRSWLFPMCLLLLIIFHRFFLIFINFVASDRISHIFMSFSEFCCF